MFFKATQQIANGYICHSQLNYIVKIRELLGIVQTSKKVKCPSLTFTHLPFPHQCKGHTLINVEWKCSIWTYFHGTY